MEKHNDKNSDDYNTVIKHPKSDEKIVLQKKKIVFSSKYEKYINKYL